MSSAIKPDFTDFASLEQSQLERDEEVVETHPIDQALYNVSLTHDWAVLDAYIGELQMELDEMVRNLMAKGASFEEIGQKTMVKELAKEYLQRIRDRIADSRNSVERANG